MRGWDVERMTPDGWRRVREIRLRALADAPDAFGTRFAEDEARPPEEWRARLASPDGVTFVATVGDDDVGLVFGARYLPHEDAAGLFGMWVAPVHRGRGIAGELVDAVVAWARTRGRARLLLDVADTNLAAIRLYASKGFEPTGEVGTLGPGREHVLEHQRALRL